MSKRTENGVALILPGEDGQKVAPVVAADIIAKVAGVSGRETARVISAIRFLADEAGISLEDLTTFEDIPTAQADAKRATATQAFFDMLAAKETSDKELNGFLRVAYRARKG